MGVSPEFSAGTTMNKQPTSSSIRTPWTAALLLFVVLGGCRESGSHSPVVGKFPHRFDAPNGEASLLFNSDTTSSWVIRKGIAVEGLLGKWTVHSNTAVIVSQGIPLIFRIEYRSDGRMRLVSSNTDERSLTQLRTFGIGNVYIEHRNAVEDWSEDVKR